MRYLFLFLTSLLLSQAAQADCAGPTGKAAEIIYNVDYKVLQYCNGTSWIGMGGGDSYLWKEDGAGGIYYSGGIKASGLNASGYTIQNVANPVNPQDAATKKYVDDQVATIETHTYTNPTWRSNAGNDLPILITTLSDIRRGAVAAALCSQFSAGAYVQGKFTSLRWVHQGYVGIDLQYTQCDGSCITGDSGHKYTWMTESDFYGSSFYSNWDTSNPGLMNQMNPPEVSTKTCSSWPDPAGNSVVVNGECMAEATATKPSASGSANPAYYWGSQVVESLLCWSN